jgi:subtilisin family serine protease
VKNRRALALVAIAVTAAAAPFAPGDLVVAQAPASFGVHDENQVYAEYTVLLAEGADRDAAMAAVNDAGGRIVRESPAISALVVQAPGTGFVERVSVSPAVGGAASARAIGHVQALRSSDPSGSVVGDRRDAPAGVERPRERLESPGPDPLDEKLWGLSMINSVAAHRIQAGDARVTVGIVDSGIDARHPDLAPNFDAVASRNFAPDIPVDPNGAELDGPCEFEDCLDPVDHDGSGHGTHVAGTVAAAANGLGLSGVAPEITLVNLRAGQDSGLFFLQPVVDALTYGADIGVNVLNMSFYVDPWLYNCTDNPADSESARIEQRTIIEAMRRALEYAHGKGATLVGSLGNNNEDLGKPRTDFSSPNYPSRSEYPRPIDNETCFDLPVEGPHVIGVSAVGPSGTKAEYSNFGTEQVTLAAPGGSSSQSGGVAGGSSKQGHILSTYPSAVLQRLGDVNEFGEVTEQGAANGVQRACDNTACGYYAYLAGTSMAAPHVSGVAALVISQHGIPDPQHAQRLTMSPSAVEQVLVESAANQACPVPAAVATPCEGTADFNGHFGHGIVDAAAAVSVRGA